ncbi:armadillo-type protein [Lineolata rhizophorae]|uniref:Armadillo-type protein n=1 Tax=Lineolata rhizophorae TaxID=578093 RepID=A0A6A6NSH1_9PEZI|nr:armadillo-type protein [Lineolata rhizophorae]
MPVTKLDKRERGHNDPMADYLSGNLGAVDTTTFLFDDDKPLKKGHAVHHSVDVVKGGYLQMETNDEKFPILVRQNGSGNGQMQLSASSAALDLALSQSPGPEAQHSHAQSHAQSQTQSNGWGGAFARPGHRRFNTLGGESDIDIEHVDFNFSPPLETPSRKAQRHSMEVKFSSPYGDGNKRPSLQTSSPNGATNGMPKQGASYSTNDIPTMKKINGFPAGSGSNTNATPTPNGDQAFHKHNTSLGRVPPGTSSNRHSRDLSAADNQGDESMFRQASAGSHSSLHASAPPFGPAISTPTPTGVTMSPTESAASTTPSTVQPYGASSNYYGFGMNMIGAGMNGPVQAWGNHMQMYPNAWGHYPSAFMQTYGPRFNPPSSDSQSRVMQQRRAQNMEDSARFGDRNLEEMQGEIYNMCKDQHGCRFLQKKLEDRDAHHVEIIFNETKDHVVELMTDPFGNYLCQKLLEFTDDQQRTVLINNASDQMVRIAFNQHGTRALQKMIEFISTREQVETIIRAFRGQVVNLIQDLNGNHVIQKCLNHLKSEDAQFIFDAVGDHCVEVGTHRHGCCVLQRCIDHASGNQKVKLVDSITRNSKALVRDPFGNYVVQYILDLQQIRFTQPVCAVLLGDIVALSKQKFSSNVVEKCIRVGDTQCKRVIIEELLRPTVLDQLLRDQYANYVIQTSLEYSPDPATRTRLVEAIRPLLSSIRGTPYGRRIANKITDRSSGDGFPSLPSSGNASGTITPNDMSTGTVPSTAAFGTMGSNGFTNNVISPQPHRVSNPTLPTQLQSSLNQNFANFATGPNPQTSSNPHGRQGQHNQSNGISGSNGMHPNGMGGGSLPPGGFF